MGPCELARRNASLSLRRLWKDPVWRRKVCKKKSISAKAAWKDPKKRKNLLRPTRDLQACLYKSFMALERWSDDKFKAKATLAIKRAMTPSVCKKIGISMKRRASSPSLIKLAYEGRKNSELWRRAVSEGSSKRWANPVFRRKHIIRLKLAWKNENRINAARVKIAEQRRSGNITSIFEQPNKSEVKLLEILKSTGIRFKYVGDGSFLVGGKNPDFINKQKRFIVEMFGDYWHRKDNPRKRNSHFKSHGYKSIVIWECELKTPNIVSNKIKNYFTEK